MKIIHLFLTTALLKTMLYAALQPPADDPDHGKQLNDDPVNYVSVPSYYVFRQKDLSVSLPIAGKTDKTKTPSCACFCLPSDQEDILGKVHHF